MNKVTDFYPVAIMMRMPHAILLSMILILAGSGCTTMNVTTGSTYGTPPENRQKNGTDRASPNGKQIEAQQRNEQDRGSNTPVRRFHATGNGDRAKQGTVEQPVTDRSDCQCPARRSSTDREDPKTKSSDPGSPAVVGARKSERPKPSEDEDKFFKRLSKQDPEFADGKRLAGDQQKPDPEKILNEDQNPAIDNDDYSEDFDDSQSVVSGEAMDSYRSDEIERQYDSVRESIKKRTSLEPSDARSSDETSLDTTTSDVTAPGVDEDTMRNFDQVGTASWYGKDFDGKKTASGEIFNSRKLTAAHKKVPLGSVVLVRNLENGKEVLVRVNDRGPFVEGRVIDLSEYGSELLGFKNEGLATVGIRLVKKGDRTASGPGLTEEYFASGSDDGEVAEVDKPDSESDYITAALGGGLDRQETRKQLPNEPELPDSVPSVEEQKGYSVQVGAFSDLRNAVNLKRYLTGYGVPVIIYESEGQYVVRAGQFRARFHAEQLKYQLVADGYSGFIVEPESVAARDRQ